MVFTYKPGWRETLWEYRYITPPTLPSLITIKKTTMLLHTWYDMLLPINNSHCFSYNQDTYQSIIEIIVFIKQWVVPCWSIKVHPAWAKCWHKTCKHQIQGTSQKKHGDGNKNLRYIWKFQKYQVLKLWYKRQQYWQPHRNWTISLPFSLAKITWINTIWTCFYEYCNDLI